MWSALAVSAALASEPATCPPEGEWLDGHRWLRAVSLDLRGVVPSPEEYGELVNDEVPEALVEAWLDSDAFAERAVRAHRALLWNNVDAQSLVSVNNMFTNSAGIYYIRNRADDYRGDINTHCGDFEASFDAAGNPIPVDIGGGIVQEGWVMVAPYWSPSTPVKVCAFEAQEAAISALGTACDGNSAVGDLGCGCGPGLAWCSINTAEDTIAASMSDEVEHRVRELIRSDAPYTDLLTGRGAGRSTWLNGPLVHYYRHLTQVPSTVRLVERPLDPDELPDLRFDQVDTWVEVSLPSHHSGVLTSPAFLLRFQTNRARANRFYNAFLCQPFQPPDSGIAIDPSQKPSQNLMTRPGCDYCHALLEPAAAHWGRWTEQGAGYLPPDTYPAFDPACFDCSAYSTDCSDVCGRYYTVDTFDAELDPFVGYLRSHQFLEPWQQVAIEVGPGLLVDTTIADGRLQTCAAEHAATWLLGAEVSGDTDPLVAAWADAFVQSGWSYKQLVKEIVLSDSYRRLR